MIDNKIYFSIPDFWQEFKLNFGLLKIYEQEKNKFYDNIIIDSIYGSFPCIWNGGRFIDLDPNLNENKIYNTLAPFVDNGVSIRYTFTNCMLKEEHLNDYMGNKILEWTNNIPNIKKQVDINLPIMDEYMRKNFPDYKIIYSTTLGFMGPEEVNKRTENDLLVLDYRYNNNFNLLNRLNNPKNIEIMCAELCRMNCPYRLQHYQNDSLKQIVTTNPTFRCPNDTTYPLELFKQNHIVSYDSINEQYLPLGLNKFKISGRSEGPIFLSEKYVRWLVKPEYRDEIRMNLLRSIFN